MFVSFKTTIFKGFCDYTRCMKNRVKDIYRIIREKGSVEVSELAEYYNVTEKTIRLNLQQLEDSGLIIRKYGGAVLANKQSDIFPGGNYNIRAAIEKEEIAIKAQEFIKPYSTIVFDDGTTNLEIAKRVSNIPLTVITNDFAIVNCLINRENINLYFVGGTVAYQDKSAHTLFQTDQEFNLIKHLKADIYFVGTNSINETGLMIFNENVKEMKRTFMSISKRSIGVADAVKFNKASFIRFANFEEIQTVITDSSFNEYNIPRYKKYGLEVLIANKIKEK